MDRIGPYSIERLLGEGGMGVVYAARRDDTGERVALKTVSALRASHLDQFRRELHALAALRHPGVVRFADHGVDGLRPWYAMELLQGETLADAVRSGNLRRDRTGPEGADATGGPWASTGSIVADATTTVASTGPIGEPAPPKGLALASGPAGPTAARAHVHRTQIDPRFLQRVLDLVARVCDTLAYIHGEGVVHGDIKPLNIFITSDGLPVLVDFGLVARGAGATGREVLDGGVFVGGSVPYVSPEQVEGRVVDPRSDLYAVGCVLYELLAGTPPFSGNAAEVLAAHVSRVPEPLGEVVAGVPPELDQLVARLLEKSRRKRPGYARDLVVTLERIGATPPPWGRPAPRARTYLYRPNLTGRDAIVQKLLDRLEKTTAGSGGIVFVEGESGIGKTRLAVEVTRRAAAMDMTVVTSGCQQVTSDARAGEPGRETARSDVAAGGPLGAFRPVLRAIIDRCIERGDAASEALLGDRGPVLAPYEPGISAVSGQASCAAPAALPPDAARNRMHRAMTEALAAFVRGAPALLVIDDVQWADELSLGLLAHLGKDGLHNAALCILGLSRAEERSVQLSELLDADWAERIELGRLGADEVRSMVAGMLSLDQPPEAFVKFLARQSEGNPFFVAEYLRMAVAEQVLVRNELGQWSIADTTQPTEVLCEGLPLPRSLKQVVERRLQKLSAASERLLHAAAVVGRAFGAGLLGSVAELEEQDVFVALDDLIRRMVIEPDEAGGGFRFAHDKLREVTYATLSDQQRRTLHERVAVALERSDTDAAGSDRRSQLGHHWMAAGKPDRAAPHLIAAGDHAMAVQALARAVALYRRALEALDAIGQQASLVERVQVGEKLADALALMGDHVAARTAFARCLELVGIKDSLARARIHRKVGKTWEITHDHEKALESYRLADAELGQVDDQTTDDWRREWVQVQLNRIWTYYWLARTDDMNELVARVSPYIQERASPLQRSNYYQALVTRDYRQHRYVIGPATLESGRLSVAAAAEAGAAVELAFAQFVLGFGLLFAGEIPSAKAMLDEGLRGARRLGDVTSETRCLAYLTLAHRRAGDVSAARRLAEETLVVAQRVGMKDYVGLCQSVLAWVAWKTGDLTTAGELAQKALNEWSKLTFRYPFQWAASLVLVAAQIERAPIRDLVALATDLLEPVLAQLPQPVEEAVRDAASAYDDGDPEGARDALERAVGEAQRLAFL